VQNEGEFGFHTQANEALGWDLATVGEEHVINQDAKIRFTDANRVLHRLGRETDLVAPDGAARGNLQRNPSLLNRVGVLDRHIRVIERKHADRSARLFGLI